MSYTATVQRLRSKYTYKVTAKAKKRGPVTQKGIKIEEEMNRILDGIEDKREDKLYEIGKEIANLLEGKVEELLKKGQKEFLDFQKAELNKAAKLLQKKAEAEGDDVPSLQEALRYLDDCPPIDNKALTNILNDVCENLSAKMV